MVNNCSYIFTVHRHCKLPCISHTAKESNFFLKAIATCNRSKVPQEVILEPQQDSGPSDRGGNSVSKDLATKAEFGSPGPM